jgi:hypothetical protein
MESLHLLEQFNMCVQICTEELDKLIVAQTVDTLL